MNIKQTSSAPPPFPNMPHKKQNLSTNQFISRVYHENTSPLSTANVVWNCLTMFQLQGWIAKEWAPILDAVSPLHVKLLTSSVVQSVCSGCPYVHTIVDIHNSFLPTILTPIPVLQGYVFKFFFQIHKCQHRLLFYATSTGPAFTIRYCDNGAPVVPLNELKSDCIL